MTNYNHPYKVKYIGEKPTMTARYNKLFFSTCSDIPQEYLVEENEIKLLDIKAYCKEMNLKNIFTSLQYKIPETCLDILYKYIDKDYI